MANNFLDDPRIIEVWRFENNLNAEKNGNNLTASAGGVGYNSSTPLEGSYSLSLDRTQNQWAYRNDANLSSGFPLKSGDTSKIFSCAFWFKPAQVTGFQHIFCKHDPVHSNSTFSLLMVNEFLRLYWGYSPGNVFHDWQIATLIQNRVYHIGLSIDGLNKTALVRLYDATLTSSTTYTKLDWTYELYIAYAPLVVGDRGDFQIGNDFSGLVDELVVANYLMTADNFDDTRDGTYDFTFPTVVTNSATDIGTHSVTGSGEVTDDGNSTITERGFCWSTSPSPTIADATLAIAGTVGVYSGNITGLDPGTTYHYRAYATNQVVGTGYGDDTTFATDIDLPTAVTNAATGIESNEAVGHGEIISSGGGTISERGFVWALTVNPTTADSKLAVSGTLGVFSGSITGLSASTLYHYRSFATNEAGTGYGDDLTILTTAGLPVISTGVVSTGDVTNINNVSSIAHGNVLSDGGSTITSRGICYALTDTPTLADNVATATGTLGEFTATLTGLVKGTIYYYRAFATNAAGTAYGGIAHFVAGFESGIVTPTPATPKTIFPELPPKLRFKLDDEYPGFYYWYTAAKKFWSTVSFKGGSFTLTAGTSTTVADARTLATSVVVMHPTNAAAAALTPYVSAKTAGTGFTLTHGIAAGTETFDYILYV